MCAGAGRRAEWTRKPQRFLFKTDDVSLIKFSVVSRRPEVRTLGRSCSFRPRHLKCSVLPFLSLSMHSLDNRSLGQHIWDHHITNLRASQIHLVQGVEFSISGSDIHIIQSTVHGVLSSAISYLCFNKIASIHLTSLQLDRDHVVLGFMEKVDWHSDHFFNFMVYFIENANDPSFRGQYSPHYSFSHHLCLCS